MIITEIITFRRPLCLEDLFSLPNSALPSPWPIVRAVINCFSTVFDVTDAHAVAANVHRQQSLGGNYLSFFVNRYQALAPILPRLY